MSSDRHLANDDEVDRVERTYERYASSPRKRRKWDSANAGNAKIRSELLVALRTEIGDRLDTGELLDIGCGSGWLLAELSDLGVDSVRLSGIDLLDARVDAARAAVPEARIGRGDARERRFADSTFDVVTMICLLSSLGGEESIGEALAEALRVLSPGGVLLCYEPRVANPLNRDTRLVSDRILRRNLGTGYRARPLTVLPPLARLLEPRIRGSYERLARVRPLLTHRLISRPR
jgi:ubiquinone/menaquinone biosynthesis C-methylase UbiE